jgi:drug/metabolite transporter (DMT)-like permease
MKSSWMLVAGLLFAVMGTCVKLGGEYFSALEMVFYRSLFGLIFIGGVILWRGVSPVTSNVRMHLSRGLSGVASLALYFYAMTKLPMATAITLNYTSPMFLTLITLLWYREPLRPRLIFAILLGFVGVILLLRPTMNESQLPAGLLGLISGCLAAIAYINVKQLSAVGEPDWRVVFYFCVVSTVTSGVLLCFDEFHAITSRGAGILMGIGASATLAQLALTRAYRVGNTLVVGALAYSAVVFASVMGVVFLREMLPFLSWIGIAVIVVAGLLAARESASTSD